MLPARPPATTLETSDTACPSEDMRGYEEDDDLWDGEGCGSSSSCCEWKDPPYFCKHLHNTTSEDMEIRLFSFYYYTSVSLIDIFVR